MQDLATLTRRAFDVLVNNELDPSTRDLVTVEGIPYAEWADGPGERERLLDEILSEYEAAAVAAGNYDAVREILRVREDCRPEEHDQGAELRAADRRARESDFPVDALASLPGEEI